MKIEFLYINGCPGKKRARELLEEVLEEENIDPEIETRKIETLEEAKEHNFPGSPTIRINGRDVEKSRRDTDYYSVTCRIYEIGDEKKGVPTKEMMRNTINSSPDDKKAPQEKRESA